MPSLARDGCPSRHQYAESISVGRFPARNISPAAGGFSLTGRAIALRHDLPPGRPLTFGTVDPGGWINRSVFVACPAARSWSGGGKLAVWADEEESKEVSGKAGGAGEIGMPGQDFVCQPPPTLPYWRARTGDVWTTLTQG